MTDMGEYEYKRDPMVEDMHRQVQETLSIVYRVLTGKEPEGVVRREEIVTLAQKLRAEVTAMHRRAQALEGVEARMHRLRITHAQQMADRYVEADRTKKMWHESYRNGVQQIKDAGVDDRINGDDLHRTGYLSEMIRRLVAQRDKATSELMELDMRLSAMEVEKVKAETERDEARAQLAAELPAAWREDLESLNASVERLGLQLDAAVAKSNEARALLKEVLHLFHDENHAGREWASVYGRIEEWMKG